MFRAWYEITNSVNDNEINVSKFFITEKEAQDCVDKEKDSVNEWNKPEDSTQGGKMSIRYIYSGVEKVASNTPLDGITFGDLEMIVNGLIHKLAIPTLKE